MSNANLLNMIKDEYQSLSREDLIRFSISQLFNEKSLTDGAFGILVDEIQKRQIDIDAIYRITSLSDEEYLNLWINEPQAFNLNCGSYFKEESQKRIKNIVSDIENVDTPKLLLLLRDFKITSDPLQKTQYLALTAYLKNVNLNEVESEIMKKILDNTPVELQKLDVISILESQQQHIQKSLSPGQVDFLKIIQAGKSLRNIGDYLVRYSFVSVGVSFGFFFLKPTQFWILYLLYVLFILILFVLIIGEFFKAGDSLIHLQRIDDSNKSTK